MADPPTAQSHGSRRNPRRYCTPAVQYWRQQLKRPIAPQSYIKSWPNAVDRMTAHPNETKAQGDKRRQFNRELGPVPETAHGKANGYNNYHCKCERCMAWSAQRAQCRRDAQKNLAMFAPVKDAVAPKVREPIVWTLELIRELQGK